MKAFLQNALYYIYRYVEKGQTVVGSSWYMVQRENLSSDSCKLTCSKTVPLNKDRYFSCCGNTSYLNPLNKVLIENGGHCLSKAIGNKKGKVK